MAFSTTQLPQVAQLDSGSLPLVQSDWRFLGYDSGDNDAVYTVSLQQMRFTRVISPNAGASSALLDCIQNFVNFNGGGDRELTLTGPYVEGMQLAVHARSVSGMATGHKIILDGLGESFDGTNTKAVFTTAQASAMFIYHNSRWCLIGAVNGTVTFTT